MNLTVNGARISTELSTLAGFTAGPPPGVTRIVFSHSDLQARAWLKARFAAAGLAIREDAVGNIFARWIGTDPHLPAVATGSHVDAIPHSGTYDGTVGVLGALEAVRSLADAGFRPRRSIELILFTSEEPTRFGIGCLGSRLLSATLAPAIADDLRDSSGGTLREVRNAAGFGAPIATVPAPAGAYHSFLELHIEQGPLLESAQIDIGVVTSIAAPASLRVTFEGAGGHAGAVLMPARSDAFLGAAELALAAESAAHATAAPDSVATTGVCSVFPGAVNSIPSRVRLELDIRDTVESRRDTMVRRIQQAADEISTRRRLHCVVESINADAPAACDPGLVETLLQIAAQTGYSAMPVVSRAYHDALFMSRIAPVSMLFIPCRRGISHRPEEFASPEAIAAGTAVLAHALAHLAGSD